MRKRVVIVVAVLLLAVAGTVYRWWWSPSDVLELVRSYRGSPQDTRITVNFVIGIGDRVMRTKFEEHTDRIVVSVRVRRDTGEHEDIGLPRQATTTLSRPIGDRTVIDASNGQPVQHE